MLKPLDHKEQIFGNSELEDFVFRARSAIISVNKIYDLNAVYFEPLTILCKAIDDRRKALATKVSPYNLWEPDEALTHWLEQNKVLLFLLSLLCLF